MPADETEIDKRKRQALQLANFAAGRYAETGRSHLGALWFAHDMGASRQEIAAATGIDQRHRRPSPATATGSQALAHRPILNASPVRLVAVP